jgi:hypothetical protein
MHYTRSQEETPVVVPEDQEEPTQEVQGVEETISSFPSRVASPGEFLSYDLRIFIIASFYD